MLLVIVVSSGCTLTPSPPAQPSPSLKQETKNQPPVILFIKAQQPVTPLDSSQIHCTASDSDGDTLYYSWSAQEGTFSGNGASITWTAPKNPGDYIITVTVNDGRGAEITESVTIFVASEINHPPNLIIIVTPKGKPPITVTPNQDPITIKRWSTTAIECFAEDPDGDTLSYKWLSDKGRLDGEGANIQYITKSSGEYTVTVIVSDGKGRQTTEKIFFHVPCCGGG